VVSAPATTTDRLHVGDPRYWEICEFLWDEADLLDHSRLLDWYALIAPDVRYQVPVRVVNDPGSPEFSERMFHQDDTYMTLGIKARRIAETTSAWAETPPSRLRRTISGIRVYRTEVDDEYEVVSSFILLRYRYDRPEPDIVSGERRDRIRRSPADPDPAAPASAGWSIARRTVLLDQTTLGTPNLAIFL
jgi:3-phenylpropionate/cinnamic acid dioxygenase small subunit